MDELPSFNLHQIDKRRDAMLERLFFPHFNVTFDGQDLLGLARQLQRYLPDVDAGVIFESLRYLAGREFTPREAYMLAWRLAGNLPRLQQGTPVNPWASQREDEWVPVQTLQCIETRNNQGVFGYRFAFRVLAGTPCPLRIFHFWRPETAGLIARRVGMTRRRGKYPFQHASQLVSLRMLVQLEAARSHGQPQFFRVECPDSMITWNREHVLRLRYRLGQQCPNNWAWACHRCAVGYEECPGGTHAKTFVLGFCHYCGHAEACFDPELSTDRCQACLRRERLRRTT